MIIRAIKTDLRDEILRKFDWFNDYEDTRRYARNCCDDETIRLLDKGYEKWKQEYLKSINRPVENTEVSHGVRHERNCDH